MTIRSSNKRLASLGETPIRILLVEDTQEHAEIIAATIMAQGEKHEIETASTAEAGVKTALASNFDLILTDYQIGEVECFEMISNLRKEQINLPIILLTGQGNESIAAAAIGEGIVDYLIKDQVFRDPQRLMQSIKSAVEKHWLEEALKESEELYRTLVENIRDGVFVLQDMLLVFANSALAKILNTDEEKIRGIDFDTLFVPEQKESVNKFIEEAWKDHPVKEVELTMLGRENKQPIFTSISISKCIYLGVTALIGTVKDVTTRVIAEQKLRDTLELTEKLSITDELTGLYNRRYVLKILETEIKRSQRYSSTLGLIMLDVDHFKQINDHYGHLVGDSALIHVADVLRRELRETDTLARYGGDEFLIVLPETNVNQVKTSAERIRTEVSKKIHAVTEDEVFKVTLSIGVTQAANKGDNLNRVIKRADDGLYKAKNKGRDRVVFTE